VQLKTVSPTLAYFSSRERQLTVQNLPSSVADFSIQLFNATGRQLYISQHNPIHGSTAVVSNMPPLAQGLIIAKITTGESIINIRVMKTGAAF
jgi:hypothetical protein